MAFITENYGYSSDDMSIVVSDNFVFVFSTKCGTTGIICVEPLVSSVWNHWYHLCGTTGIICVEPLVSSVWNHRSLPSCLVLTCLSVWLPAFGVCAISFIMEGSSWLIENGLMEIIFFCPLSIWDPSPKIRCWQELGLGLGIRATNFRGHLHLRPTSKTIYTIGK